MGSSQSSRKLTISNDEANIIKVSEAVVDKIKKATESKNTENVTSPQPSPISKTSPVKPLADPVLTEGQVLASYPYYYGPPITALQALQEKETEIKEVDKYWSNRLINLEEQQKKLSKLMEEQYNVALNDVNKQLPKLGIRRTEMPCKDKRQQLIDCYRQHPSEALLCAKQVSEFSACIDRERRAA